MVYTNLSYNSILLWHSNQLKQTKGRRIKRPQTINKHTTMTQTQKAVVILQQVDQDGNVLQSYQVVNPAPFEDGNGFDYCYENGDQGWAWDCEGKKWELKPNEMCKSVIRQKENDIQ